MSFVHFFYSHLFSRFYPIRNLRQDRDSLVLILLLLGDNCYLKTKLSKFLFFSELNRYDDTNFNSRPMNISPIDVIEILKKYEDNIITQEKNSI